MKKNPSKRRTASEASREIFDVIKTKGRNDNIWCSRASLFGYCQRGALLAPPNSRDATALNRKSYQCPGHKLLQTSRIGKWVNQHQLKFRVVIIQHDRTFSHTNNEYSSDNSLRQFHLGVTEREEYERKYRGERGDPKILTFTPRSWHKRSLLGKKLQFFENFNW